MTFSDDYTIPKMIADSTEKYKTLAAQNIRQKGGDFKPVTYEQTFQLGLDFAAGLLSLNVKREEPIGLISDNRAEWLQADIGIMSIRAIDVPRGCDATLNDLEKIISTTECRIVIGENSSQLNKIISIKEKVPSVQILIHLCPESEIKESTLEDARKAGLTVYSFEKLIETGKKWRVDNKDVVESELKKGNIDEVATIIFTSGTTGTPKGVMLTHKNFLYQLDEIVERIFLNPGDNILNVLPVWHVFERECEYVTLIQGGVISYSKPIGTILLASL